MHVPEEAWAQCRAYHLFAQLYRDGLTDDLITQVRGIPVLSETLKNMPMSEQRAADHYQLFGLEVFPYASVFLEETTQVGGAITRDVYHFYQQAGFQHDERNDNADHIVHELAFLAFLTGAEAEAWEDGKETVARHLRSIQRRFMQEHLLWWLPGFAKAILQQGHTFYTTLAQLTLDLILSHADLQTGEGSPFDLPEPPDLLTSPQTGAKDIAEYLTRPAWSGLYLSRSDIARLGRNEQVPRGFGGRVLMLTNLLRAAITYDKMDSMLAQLQGLVQDWQSYYLELEKEPGMHEVARMWSDRLDGTEKVLQQILTALTE